MASPPVTPADNLQKIRLFAERVRLFMRDFPILNRLIEGEETNARMMIWAVIDALDDFNVSPPPIGTLEVDQVPSSILLRGAVCTVLESVGILQTRNQLNVSDGGITVGISDKAPMLMQWVQMFRNQYEQKKLQWKTSQNIMQAFGHGVVSEYYYTSGWYGAFPLSFGGIG